MVDKEEFASIITWCKQFENEKWQFNSKKEDCLHPFIHKKQHVLSLS